MSTSKLKILAIDTATEACSVALYIDGNTTQKIEISPNGHSKLVLDMVQELLQQAGLELQELDALAVDIGPGSFTGLRIGVGVVQGLAYGVGLQVIPVGSLEVLAAALPDNLVLAAIDARMQQIYYGFYRLSENGELSTIIEPALIEPENLIIRHEGVITGTGSGWDRYAAIMTGSIERERVNWLAGRYPEAVSAVRLAAARGLQHAISPLVLAASYVRVEVAKSPIRAE